MATYYAATPPSLPTAGDIWINSTAAKFGDIQVFDGAVWKESDIPAAAGTLTGTTLASNVVSSSLTSVGILGSPHMTGAVVDNGGFQVAFGNVGIGTAPVGQNALQISGSGITSTADQAGVVSNLTFSSAATSSMKGFYSAPVGGTGTYSTGNIYDYYADAPTKGGSQTITSTFAYFAAAITTTCTNALPAFISTPTGGSGTNTHLVLGGQGAGSNQYIDTNAGAGTPAHLTTSGSFTNASSWKESKIDTREVDRETVAGWLKTLAQMPQPQFYRYPFVACDNPSHKRLVGQDAESGKDIYEDYLCGVCRSGHQEHHYDSLFHFLDDIPEELREVICDDAGGGISTKDTEGFLMACVQQLARMVLAGSQEAA